MVALAPEVALGRIAYDAERTVRELQARIDAQRIDAQRIDYLGLVPHYAEAREQAMRCAEIQVLEDLATIRDFLAGACRDTHKELLVAHPTRHLVDGLPQDLEMLSRGVVRRSLCLKSGRDSPAVQRGVTRAVDAGAEVRVLPVIPVRVMCFDASVAVLSRSVTPDDTAAIVIRETNLAHSIRQVFLAAWDSAEPFSQDKWTGPTPSRLDAAILEALALGQSDEQIARHQDVSVRTCRRHIHDLVERLGAQSRFQAGVLAAKRNWI